MKFSVITPNFNQEIYIRQTICSVLDQKVEVDLEYIVMDGASTDRSMEIVRSFGDQIDIVHSEKDEGQAHAINKGLKLATGDWICYLNSDDLFFTGTLAKVAQLIDQNPECKWISGCSRKFGSQGQTYEIGKPNMPERSPIDWVTYKANCPQVATFFHREVLDSVGYFDTDFHFCFDTEFWLRIWLAGYRPLLTDEILAGFRIHDASKTMTSQARFLDEHRKMMNKHKVHFTPSEMKQAEKELDRRLAVHLCYASNESENAWHTLLAALKYHPAVIRERFFWGALKNALQ